VNAPTPAIEVKVVRKTFRMKGGLLGTDRHVVAVDDISFTVPTGGVLGVVGESGCGKSNIAVEGQRVIDMDRKARARLIQPVFQDPFASLNPLARVRDIVAMPLRAQGDIGRSETAKRVDEMLARVGLSSELGQRLPTELSGGQRQRVAIARALVLRPRIVVCDEPTSALDVSVQAQILNLLAELRRELGLTYLFISHNLAVVEHVASEVAVMYLGRFVERAPTETLFRAPEHPYTKALLASVLTPEPGLGVPDVGLGDILPDPANIPPGCRFHPRCPIAEPRCAIETPPLKPRPAGGVECLLVP
jgi:peptide/nickel transport system ATP-binding protein